MTMRQIDPGMRLMARVLSIRHVDNPLVRGITRIAMRHIPSPRIPGVNITVACHGSLRIYNRTSAGQTTAEGRAAGSTTAGFRPALLWIHGGGLVVGAASQDDGLCARTAARLGIVVISVEYRLAPEHPYPAAMDDVFHAWQWMLAHAERLRIDTTRLAIGGESAGGGIAACLVQRVHDSDGPQPRAQWLFAPMLDGSHRLRSEPGSYRSFRVEQQGESLRVEGISVPGTGFVKYPGVCGCKPQIRSERAA